MSKCRNVETPQGAAPESPLGKGGSAATKRPRHGGNEATEGREVTTGYLRSGRFRIILGCMFSGKTTELLLRATAMDPQCVLLFKHAIDRRYREDAVVSHDGLASPAVVVAQSCDIEKYVDRKVKLVAIDEAHFFDDGLVEVVGDLRCRGYDVLTTALDRNSWGDPFPVIERLDAIADEHLIRFSICARCGERGDHTQRTTPIIDGNMIGGRESYEPRCGDCWRPPREPPPESATTATSF